MGPMPPPPVPNAAGTCGGGKSAHKKGSQAALAGTAGQLKRSMRVLLVEPDDREREALRSVLEDSCKYTVTAVATCLEAADLLLGRSSHEMQRSTEGQGQREQDTEAAADKTAANTRQTRSVSKGKAAAAAEKQRQRSPAEGDAQFDLIVTEVSTPEGTALALMRSLARHEGLCRMPTVVMGAHNDTRQVVGCLKCGAADYLVKPLRPNELQNLWTHVWRMRRLGDSAPCLVDATDSEESGDADTTSMLGDSPMEAVAGSGGGSDGNGSGSGSDGDKK
eukprot:PRCOL_00002223-RA